MSPRWNVAISPKHYADDFPNGLRLDDKIGVFIERVEGWHLGVANAMVETQARDRGFALLMIVVSYFEMIAKYRDGYVEETKGKRKGEGKSAHYFKEGLKYVFPHLALPDTYEAAEAIYENVRNGLYHTGVTRSNVFISNDIASVVDYDTKTGTITINPDALVKALQAHFADFSAELKNPANTGLRANFEARFDVDNS
jgi:hypothetical protein